DFVLEADQANATPLLGLVPVLADLGAGAEGDLLIEASGTLSAPRIVARTDGLDLALAGARYRLEATEATLTGPDLSVRAELTGVEPVGGRLVVEGDGALRLDPWRLEDAAVALRGDVNVPLVGEITDLDGVIDADPDGLPRLTAEGRLGEPLSLTGTLWPLDLRARGTGLDLRMPTFLLERTRADVDLRMRFDDAFALGGSVTAREGRFALGIRPRPAAGAVRDGTSTPSPGLSRFVFDDLTIAGRRLAFSESVGSAEFDVDLRLTGTAATPRLSGQANATRGTFRFAGRDFQVTEGVARFEPSRGVWPNLTVAAALRFDKATVLASALPGTRFEVPPGSTFQVRLSFDAEVIPTPVQTTPFRLDVDPVLESDAVVSLPVDTGFTTGARSLTEAELLSLVTLGRLDLSEQLAGAGGIATGVARTALDSAVDLLVLAELQNALSQALGLDLVQIRTSTLSSVIAGGGDDPFGVSLRLGGYLDEGLFASFELGRYADASEALSNTFALTYELGPLALDLSTRVGFRSATDLQPVPQVAAGIRYQLTPALAIEGSTSLSTEEGDARFGVTLRW
ncbi:MAG: translocation/assembly module TamB domain-containing protein, partial [Trueperaceae bacterium]